ncbi:uncharacterized protein LOC116295210 [Actinia tenebrosa]|uniref:Uncharacterized protein LOC116295210 n=1 Tax=Actinia tenebrosa TaxID=6105 RepID=A0A6P8HR35_ACTTE|nr:uncharacterized protein LOC116295210 [Actinia tenebrosa]
MPKVLVLFVKSDEQESKRLKDCLQAKLGTIVDFNTVKDALAEDSNLKNELAQSRGVILVSSKQSSEFIKQGTQEKEGSYVLFDGRLIQQQLQSGNILSKLVVVQFGSAVTDAYVPDGYDKQVFVLDANFSSTDAVLDQIEDTVKGSLTSKVTENVTKKKKDCNLL